MSQHRIIRIDSAENDKGDKHAENSCTGTGRDRLKVSAETETDDIPEDAAQHVHQEKADMTKHVLQYPADKIQADRIQQEMGQADMHKYRCDKPPVFMLKDNAQRRHRTELH